MIEVPAWIGSSLAGLLAGGFFLTASGATGRDALITVTLAVVFSVVGFSFWHQAFSIGLIASLVIEVWWGHDGVHRMRARNSRVNGLWLDAKGFEIDERGDWWSADPDGGRFMIAASMTRMMPAEFRKWFREASEGRFED